VGGGGRERGREEGVKEIVRDRERVVIEIREDRGGEGERGRERKGGRERGRYFYRGER
jgi:hypothetical protein